MNESGGKYFVRSISNNKNLHNSRRVIVLLIGDEDELNSSFLTTRSTHIINDIQ